MGRDQLAEDLLAAALVVGVGGVEHVDAFVQTAPDHARGPLLVHLGAEGHGAHYEPGDLEVGVRNRALLQGSRQYAPANTTFRNEVWPKIVRIGRFWAKVQYEWAA